MSDIPIYKVGAVLVHGDRVLLVRPHPKNAGEVPPLVLPRGSRQYRDAQGDWRDARDAETAQRHADTLEPLARALAREVEEEAGLPAALLPGLPTIDLGPMAFQSRSKGLYPVHWFQLTLDDAAVGALRPPADASEVRWMTMEAVRAGIMGGTISAGYWPVIARVLGEVV